MTAVMRSNDVAASDPAVLEKSRAYCRDLTKREAKNFYYGLKLLPEPKRSAMYALYAYMRLVDDIADDDANERTLAQRKGDLDQWETLTHQTIAAGGEAESPKGHILWPAFGDMVRRYKVPAKLFDDMIAGQRQDLEPVRIQHFDELHAYCYRVASVVGLASLYIWGFEGGEETLKLSADRGIAFQLTNVLRDLREDAAPPRGRCYLPQDELAKFGVTEQALAKGEMSPAMVEFLRFQVERAESFYQRSAPLEGKIRADSRPTLVAMTGIYHGILRKIADDPSRVMKERVRLSTLSKVMIGWRAMREKT
jgi:15-cis-phytoene synthase